MNFDMADYLAGIGDRAVRLMVVVDGMMICRLFRILADGGRVNIIGAIILRRLATGLFG
ncbi:MAG: hypothetical protein LBJ61_00185 [Deltaproteobacteria bacterium]|nr:hypothetical protein [Deltaproteobacteria bacterium]